MPKQKAFDDALKKLRAKFAQMTFPVDSLAAAIKGEIIYKWPGRPCEDVMICAPVFTKREKFHRHDFFYFNFTMSGRYNSISSTMDTLLTIKDGELYAGQPSACHALHPTGDASENIIIGVLIQKRVFFKDFLPMICADTKLFSFFLEPEKNSASNEFLHFKMRDDSVVRTLLKIMAIEYAAEQEDTQAVLKPLALSFLMQVSRQYALNFDEKNEALLKDTLSNKIIRYISTHIKDTSLADIAKRFSRHPNYISALLKSETGFSFSQILFDLRMERAKALLSNTLLSIEEIAYMTGYNGSSNFYKAFHKKFGMSPREFMNKREKG